MRRELIGVAMVSAGVLVAGSAGLVGGCGEQSAGTPAGTPAERDAAGADSAWVMASMPEGAVAVSAAKAGAAEGDEVVVRGRIGGRASPMSTEGPVFMLVDLELPHCGELPDDHCKTPWDYCCETPETITANSATVQVVGADGSPIAGSPAGQGFAPLDEVVVVGTVGPRPSEAVLTIRATGVYRVKGEG